MTIRKKPTNLNRKSKPLGKLYRSFEDDIWGRFIYKHIHFDVRYKYLLKSPSNKLAYTNMSKMWDIIKAKQFASCIKQDNKDHDKYNILRLDIINPKRKKRRITQSMLATINAKKFRAFYIDIKSHQIKCLVREFKKENLSKYKIFLLALETRLDVMVYRLHFVNTIGDARQLISHRNITVNGRIVDRRNFQLKPLDVISSILEKRSFFLRNILYRLLPFGYKEILYYYPCYYEVNFRILAATFIGYNVDFSEANIPFFSSVKASDGFVYHTYKSK